MIKLKNWLKKQKWDSLIISKTSPLSTKIYAHLLKIFTKRKIYFCDGIHDEEEIQRAIDELAGSTIMVSRGTFNIGDKICMKDGNVLIGKGKNTILRMRT